MFYISQLLGHLYERLIALLVAIVLNLIFVFGFCLNANAVEFKWEYHSYITKICSEYNICPELVEAIIFYESSWKEDAVSRNGQCIGLMQINANVHKQRMQKLGVTNLKDGKQNIRVGIDILADLFEQYEEAELVLDAYNGNLRNESFYIKNRSAYARRVLQLSAELEERHGKIGGYG